MQDVWIILAMIFGAAAVVLNTIALVSEILG